MPDFEDDDDYEVGYGRPPVAHQFKRGAPSPNPVGRPKGAKGRKSIIRQIANETREYSEGGIRRRASTLELVVLAVRNRVAQGDLRALKLSDMLSGEESKEEPQVPKGVLILPDTLTHEEWLLKYSPHHCGEPASE